MKTKRASLIDLNSNNTNDNESSYFGIKHLFGVAYCSIDSKKFSFVSSECFEAWAGDDRSSFDGKIKPLIHKCRVGTPLQSKKQLMGNNYGQQCDLTTV